jgi:hypothetical protein
MTEFKYSTKKVFNNKGEYKDLYDLNVESDFNSDIYLENVVVIEKKKGSIITLFNDNKGKTKLFINQSIAQKNDKKHVEVAKFINEELGKEYRALFEEIGKGIEAQLYGILQDEGDNEVISFFKMKKRLQFFDIKINNCHIQYDDFLYFMNKYHIPYLNPIAAFKYNGNEPLISLFQKNKEMNSVIVKPIFNRDMNSSGGWLNDGELKYYYFNNPFKVKQIEHKEIDFADKADTIVSKILDKTFIEDFVSKVYSKNLSFKEKKFKSEILSMASMMVLSSFKYLEMEKEIKNKAENLEVENSLRKEIKKKVPQMIIKIFYNEK